MLRIWNFYYYATWKLVSDFGVVLIEKPLVSFFNSSPTLKRNWNRGKSEYYRVVKSKDYGVNIGSAYNLMLFSTMIIYASFCLILVDILNLEVGDKIYRYFIAVVFLSYATNYFLLHKADVYKRYFGEFDKINNKLGIYLSAILFHAGILVFGTLSIYFTIGFNL